MYGPTHYKFSTAVVLAGVNLLDIFAGTGVIWQVYPIPVSTVPLDAQTFILRNTIPELLAGHAIDIPGYHLTLSAQFNLIIFLAILLISFVSGLLPDADCEHGTLGNLPEKFIALDHHVMKSHIILLTLSLFFLNIMDFILDAHFHLVRVISGGHRHATHWLLTSFVWAFFLEGIFILTGHREWWPIAFAAWLAYLAHLASDALTKAGIPAFGPFDRNRYHLWPRPFRVRAGGVFDRFLGATSLVFALVLMAIPLWVELHKL